MFGPVKEAARRCAAAPQRGGARLDGACARSPGEVWPSTKKRRCNRTKKQVGLGPLLVEVLRRPGCFRVFSRFGRA